MLPKLVISAPHLQIVGQTCQAYRSTALKSATRHRLKLGDVSSGCANCTTLALPAKCKTAINSPNQIVGSCIEPTLSILFEQDCTDARMIRINLSILS